MKDEDMSDLCPSVLGRILLLQSALHAAPDEIRMAEMLAHGLKRLPGIGSVATCIEGNASGDVSCAGIQMGDASFSASRNSCGDGEMYVSAEMSEYPAGARSEIVGNSAFMPDGQAPEVRRSCPRLRETSSCAVETVSPMSGCPVKLNPEWKRLALSTGRREYGAVFLRYSDCEAFAPYAAFADNTANLAALFIENMRHERELREMNAELTRRVRERTRELSESNERFRKKSLLLQTVMDGIEDIIGIQKPDHSIVEYNKAGYEILGLTERQVRGKKCYELLGRSAPDEECATSRALLTRQVEHVERYVPELGRHYLCRSMPVLDDHGEVSFIVEQLHDVTARKIAEEALRQSEANFRLFVESITDILVAATPEGQVLFTNQAASKKLGYSDAELAVLHLLEWHRPEDRAEAEVVFSKMLSGLLDHCPLPLQAKDGAIIPVETRIWLGTWSGRDCVFGICKDLTAQQESQQRFERIFYNNPCPMALSSVSDRRFIEVNEAFLETTGYARDEVIGRTSAALGLLTDPDGQTAMAEALTATGSVANWELQLCRKDGIIRDGLFSGEIIRNQGRELFLTVMVDITERKRAEAQLRLQSLVLNQIQDRVTVVDLNGIITYVNDAEACALGYEREQLIGKSTDVFGEDAESGPTQREIMDSTLQHGQWRGEIVNRTADGRQIILECRTLTVLDEQGNAIALAGCSTDITERKRMEEDRLKMERRMQHAQKLESLGVLAGGIAHDFNNLLMSILGRADLALDDISPNSPARNNIDHIVVATRRAADLCSQMLAYSGKGSFIIEPVNLSRLIEEMSQLLKTSISKKVVLHLQAQQPLPNVEGDITQLRQVIMNLVINASEAIGDAGGVIRVSTCVSQLNNESLLDVYYVGNPFDGAAVCVAIEDNGCGMDAETRSKIFEPFFTTKFTGRGLGMAAVLGIVQGHKGVMTIESAPGRGTLFRLFLPQLIVCETDEPNMPQRGDKERKPGVRILLVDDEDSIRALGQAMLERIGFQVIVASDGREAVAVYERELESIDLVLLDLTMPHMDGVETLRELQKLDPTVKVVMTSGYSNQEVQARSAGQTLLGIIQKPYSMAQLRECLCPILVE